MSMHLQGCAVQPTCVPYQSRAVWRTAGDDAAGGGKCVTIRKNSRSKKEAVPSFTQAGRACLWMVFLERWRADLGVTVEVLTVTTLPVALHTPPLWERADTSPNAGFLSGFSAWLAGPLENSRILPEEVLKSVLRSVQFCLSSW